MRLNIIGKRKIWYAISFVLVAVSVAAIALWGLRLGVDFTGGSLIQVQYAAERPAVTDVQERLHAADVGSVTVQPAGDKDVIIRVQGADEATHQKVLAALREGVPAEQAKDAVREVSYETVGPTVGAELRRRSFTAIAMVLLAIIAYISFAFRKVSRPVSSWKYGLAAIVALLHDVIIPTGVIAVLGHFFGVEVDVLFVTAVLTVLGFSVHDTIVVFDRIRENLRRSGGASFEEVVNRSINETFARSVNTSLTALLVLLAVYLFGGESIRNFVLVLLIGIGIGTYSSIFIASPILVTWQLRNQKKR